LYGDFDKECHLDEKDFVQEGFNGRGVTPIVGGKGTNGAGSYFDSLHILFTDSVEFVLKMMEIYAILLLLYCDYSVLWDDYGK